MLPTSTTHTHTHTHTHIHTYIHTHSVYVFFVVTITDLLVMDNSKAKTIMRYPLNRIKDVERTAEAEKVKFFADVDINQDAVKYKILAMDQTASVPGL